MHRIIKNLPNINFILTIALVYFGFVNYGIILSSAIALFSGIFFRNTEQPAVKQAYSEYGFFLLFIVIGFFQWGLIPLGITTFISFLIGLNIHNKTTVLKFVFSFLVLISTTVISIYLPSNLAKMQLHDEVNESTKPYYLYDLEGNYISLEDLKGKVVVLNFWATWCYTCHREMPKFKATSEKFQNNPNVVFIGVNSGGQSDNLKKVIAFVEEKKYDFKILMDGNASSIFNIEALPSLVILDKNGVLRVKHMGYSPAEDFENYLIDEVNKLL